MTQTTTVSTPSSTTTTTNTVATTSGTAVYPAAGTVASVASSTTTAGTTKTTSSNNWVGVMNFMVRWLPVPSLTVDVFGQSIMNALNFNLFATTAGNSAFNPKNFINNLGLSVTYHVE